jgi:hypothetical protein
MYYSASFFILSHMTILGHSPSGMRENSAPEDHEPQGQVGQERSRALAVEQVPGGRHRRRIYMV